VSGKSFGAHAKWQSATYKEHVASLERRGLTVKQAIARGYEPLTALETRKAIRQDVGPTIAITCLKADGTEQEERRYCLIDDDTRKQTGKKYTQRYGTGVIIHVRRALKRKGKSGVAYITEGEFKADAIAEAAPDATIISVPGVRSFMLDGELHPDIAAALPGVKVLKFAYDTDQMENVPGVLAPMFAAADVFAAKKIKVRFVSLPPVPDLAKSGADDVIQHLGTNAFLGAPEHDYDSPWAGRQRERITGATGQPALLPEFSLKPNVTEWLTCAPPDLEFLLEGYLPRGIVALLIAVGGAGKTNLALQLATAVAGGETFFDLKSRAARVAYIGLEDPPEVFHRRVHRIYRDQLADLRIRNDPAREKRYADAVRENLTIRSLVGQQLHLIGMDHGVVVQSEVLDELIAKLKDAGVEFLVLDPMSRLHGTEENSNPVGTALINTAERIAREVGCTVLINHHTGKANATSGNETAYAARGASGIADAARCVLVLRAIDEKEGKRIKNVTLEQVARGDVMRLVHAKSNYTRKMQDLWLLRGEYGGFESFVPEFADAADDYATFAKTLRLWALAHPEPFSQNTVAETHRTEIFKDLSRAKVIEFLDRAVCDGMLTSSGKQGRGGGQRYTVAEAKHAAA